MRPALEPADRAPLAGLSRLLSKSRRERFFVRPETLLRWHRDLVRRRWTYKRSRVGPPGVPSGTVRLVLRLVRENPTRGYRRIHGELATMGVRLAAPSVWALRKRHGIDPSPRRWGTSWNEFLRAQAATVRATDFFTVDTIVLKRLDVLFFIELDTQRVYVTGITAKPAREWVTRQARNLSVVLSERVRPVKFVIRDCDTKFTASVDEEFGAEGIEVIRTPVRLTRAHAFAERLVGTVRRECLDLVTHYNQHRPHRSLAQRAPLALERARSPFSCPDATRLRRTDKLGGLVHEYRLAA